MTYVHVVHGWVWKWGQQVSRNANWPYGICHMHVWGVQWWGRPASAAGTQMDQRTSQKALADGFHYGPAGNVMAVSDHIHMYIPIHIYMYIPEMIVC